MFFQRKITFEHAPRTRIQDRRLYNRFCVSLCRWMDGEGGLCVEELKDGSRVVLVLLRHSLYITSRITLQKQ